MTSVTVEYQKPIPPLRTRRSSRNKELFKLAKSNFIRGPSIRTNLEPLVFQEAVELGFNKDFIFKNHIRRESPTSSIRTLNNRHLFTISRL
jgi:hypothetical protein